MQCVVKNLDREKECNYKDEYLYSVTRIFKVEYFCLHKF